VLLILAEQLSLHISWKNWRELSSVHHILVSDCCIIYLLHVFVVLFDVTSILNIFEKVTIFYFSTQMCLHGKSWQFA